MWLIVPPGEIIKKIDVNKRAHNTIYGPSGEHVYLDDIASPWLYVADAKKHELVNKSWSFCQFCSSIYHQWKRNTRLCDRR